MLLFQNTQVYSYKIHSLVCNVRGALWRAVGEQALKEGAKEGLGQ